MKPSGTVVVLLPLLALLVACREEAPKPSFEVRFDVLTENSVGLPGAKVSLRGREVGLTNGAGRLELSLPPESAEVSAVSLRCPPGYQELGALPPLKLARVRDLNDPAKFRPINYAATCERATRDSVIVVKADGGAGLPVKIQGKEVGRVNSDGIGHFLVSAQPGTEIEVILDTKSAPRLRPRNPSKSVVIGKLDEVVLFAPQFAEVVPKRTIPRPPPEKPRPILIR